MKKFGMGPDPEEMSISRIRLTLKLRERDALGYQVSIKGSEYSKLKRS